MELLNSSCRFIEYSLLHSEDFLPPDMISTFGKTILLFLLLSLHCEIKTALRHICLRVSQKSATVNNGSALLIGLMVEAISQNGLDH
jgi:hypothetical protein